MGHSRFQELFFSFIFDEMDVFYCFKTPRLFKPYTLLCHHLHRLQTSMGSLHCSVPVSRVTYHVSRSWLKRLVSQFEHTLMQASINKRSLVSFTHQRLCQFLHHECWWGNSSDKRLFIGVPWRLCWNVQRASQSALLLFSSLSSSIVHSCTVHFSIENLYQFNSAPLKLSAPFLNPTEFRWRLSCMLNS